MKNWPWWMWAQLGVMLIEFIGLVFVWKLILHM